MEGVTSECTWCCVEGVTSECSGAVWRVSQVSAVVLCGGCHK